MWISKNYRVGMDKRVKRHEGKELKVEKNKGYLRNIKNREKYKN